MSTSHKEELRKWATKNLPKLTRKDFYVNDWDGDFLWMQTDFGHSDTYPSFLNGHSLGHNVLRKRISVPPESRICSEVDSTTNYSTCFGCLDFGDLVEISKTGWKTFLRKACVRVPSTFQHNKSYYLGTYVDRVLGWSLGGHSHVDLGIYIYSWVAWESNGVVILRYGCLTLPLSAWKKHLSKILDLYDTNSRHVGGHRPARAALTRIFKFVEKQASRR